jgi:spermidine synthase
MTIGNESLDLWIEDLFAGQVGLRLRLRDCLFSATSPFQRIAVYDSLAFGRVLTLGGAIAVTDFDEAIYSECLAHPALAAMPTAKRVLIIGGGDGGVAREALRYAVERVTVVEIDKQVVETCAKFFPNAASSLKDKRVELVIDDAHRWLKGVKQPYDVIIVDAAELVNPASDAFHSVTFAQAVFGALAPDGVLVAPLGSPMHASEHCRGMLRQLADKFPRPQVYAFPLPSQPAGELAVAWSSQRHQPTAAAQAKAAWHGDLKSWYPALTPALFTLPRQTQQRLGIG